VNLDGANPSVAGMTFNSTGSYTIAEGSGGSITLQGSSSVSVTVQAGNHQISAPLGLAGSTSFTTASGSSLIVSGPISGNGSLSKTDDGTLVLSGANLYTGGTTVTAGTLDITNSAALLDGSSLTVSSSGTLLFGSSVDVTPSAVVAAAIPVIASSVDTSSDTPAAACGDASVTTATPSTTSLAPSGLVMLAPSVADLAPSGSVAMPSSVSTSASVVDSLVQSSAIVATPPVALPRLASPLEPQSNKQSKSVHAGTLITPAVDPVDWSPRAKRVAEDLTWLGQAASSSDNWDGSDQYPKKDQTLVALEAVFAQYGL